MATMDENYFFMPTGTKDRLSQNEKPVTTPKPSMEILALCLVEYKKCHLL